jgi:uncharacterized membrane protein/protein-disulfide isomerase
MSSTTRWVIVALSLVGLGFAGASTWVHYRSLTDPSYVSPCDVSAAFNCTQVYLSRYGSVAGVPVAIGGLVWFGLTALIAAFARPVNGESAAAGYLLALSIVGTATIVYLAYVSFAVLGTGCLLCMGTYACVIGIFAAVLRSRPVALTNLPARLGTDLRSVVAQPLVLVCALAYLTASVGAVTLFPDEEEAARQAAAAPAPTAGQQLDFATAWKQQPRVEMGIDPEGASVVVVKYNDFECPSCRQAEVYYKSVFDKFAASHPGAVKYVVKDWPLDSACNFHMMSTVPRHEAACDAAAAARMARDRGKYQEMVDWIYANQGVTQAEMRAAAQRILGVTDFDREYAQKLPEIRKDIADGGVLNITSTPTYFINGVRLPGGFPLQSFEMAITLELEAARQRAQSQ